MGNVICIFKSDLFTNDPNEINISWQDYHKLASSICDKYHVKQINTNISRIYLQVVTAIDVCTTGKRTGSQVVSILAGASVLVICTQTEYNEKHIWITSHSWQKLIAYLTDYYRLTKFVLQRLLVRIKFTKVTMVVQKTNFLHRQPCTLLYQQKLLKRFML